MCVPNVMRIALFVLKLLRWSQNFDIAHVTLATPCRGHFVFHTWAGSVIRLCTILVTGIPNLGH